ncbi:AAA family ATPase [Chitinophaga pinensis]|uniref:Uncharacterized protein n=1 Tax=Chitinophaga pinensis (strain ATCC 43595 / DSM 2588 / LMG 13176 / NBRC 15968 / NCIMB 11800 / UQM 2034) TaxID=485918 RepID=A0A979G5C9_CHIPD|nr:hypothetical protein [Chitinophaga pinensis]ACU60973.1 conserved hypothetical protein [Chitinophaga pinensis DSM 2588]
MKKFILSELLLLSQKDRKAKRVIFDPRRTLILGSNGTGKSSLIKSVYRCFGASPATDHPAWKDVDPILLAKFSIDDKKYSILKDAKFYAIFGERDELLGAYSSITKGLGPFLAELFDFNIKLPNQVGSLINLPPAFLFLPYYIDQDSGWQKSWSSFSSLTLIKGYREPIVNYHTGIKPNEYYETKNKVDECKMAIKSLEAEKIVLNTLLLQIKEKIADTDFNVDMQTFAEELNELLFEYEQLKIEEGTYKNKLLDLYNQKIALDQQAKIAKSALKETVKDYAYAREELIDELVECPTCGAHYENSFHERFQIANDEDNIRDLLTEIEKELSSVEEKIAAQNDNLSINTKTSERIELLLNKSKESILLRDVIGSAGRNEVKSVFELNNRNLVATIYDRLSEQTKLEGQLKSIIDKNRKKEIIDFYQLQMRKNLQELDVSTLKPDDYKRIDAAIPETGSALPRALTAYYFSIFEVIRKYSTSTFCPIVIDSPNQQAQDTGHIDKVLNFINRNQPEDSQLILGMEELYGVDFDCKIVELRDKGSLLQKDEFDEVKSIIRPFIDLLSPIKNRGRLF